MRLLAVVALTVLSFSAPAQTGGDILRSLVNQSERVFEQLDALNRLYPAAKEALISQAASTGNEDRISDAVTLNESIVVSNIVTRDGYGVPISASRARIGYYPDQLRKSSIGLLNCAYVGNCDPREVYAYVVACANRTLTVNAFYLANLRAIDGSSSNADIFAKSNADLIAILDALRVPAYNYLGEAPASWADRYGASFDLVVEETVTTTSETTTTTETTGTEVYQDATSTDASTTTTTEETTTTAPSTTQVEEETTSTTTTEKATDTSPSTESSTTTVEEEKKEEKKPILPPQDNLKSTTSTSASAQNATQVSKTDRSVLVKKDESKIVKNWDLNDVQTMRIHLIQQLKKRQNLSADEKALLNNLEKRQAQATASASN